MEYGRTWYFAFEIYWPLQSPNWILNQDIFQLIGYLFKEGLFWNTDIFILSWSNVPKQQQSSYWTPCWSKPLHWHFRTPYNNNLIVKFRYSEKATKFWSIFHLKFDVKKEWTMWQMFVVFSEYMNLIIFSYINIQTPWLNKVLFLSFSLLDFLLDVWNSEYHQGFGSIVMLGRPAEAAHTALTKTQ